MHLSGLFVYPIKACAGVALDRARLVARGLELDRRYMLVDRSGRFVTQREAPELCRVTPQLDVDCFVLQAPSLPDLSIARAPEGSADVSCHIWGDVVSALRCEDGSRWFSRYLRREVELVYMPESVQRPVNPKRARPGDVVSFADAYPLLVISEASLADLNARLDAPVDMRRFRPNLVLSGCEPFAEDHLTRLSIGAVALRAVKRCERCVVTTVDPDTSERNKEPLRTLAQYRLEDGKIWFGMNLIHDSAGLLTVGDAVLPAQGQ